MSYKNYVYISLFVCSIALQSCSSSPRIINKATYPKESLPSIQDEATDIGKISDDVSKTAADIDGASQGLEKEIPEDLKPKTSAFFDFINVSTNTLRSLAESMRQVQKRLVDEQKKADQLVQHTQSLETDKSKLIEEIEKLRDENARLLKKMLAWLAAASVAGIGICIFIVLLTQNKMAIFAALGFAATMAVAVAVSIYMTWIAFITAIVFGVSVILAAIYVWKGISSKKKEIKIKDTENKTVNNALEEVVKTTELTKQYMSKDDRKGLFGDESNDGKIDKLKIQSDTTKSLVKKIRQSEVKDENSPLFRKTE